ncbi:MAG: hypothetical protein [Circoviridae sp.]|nr:MAG: hypothetical protein [Circoviridae sp.]
MSKEHYLLLSIFLLIVLSKSFMIQVSISITSSYLIYPILLSLQPILYFPNNQLLVTNLSNWTKPFIDIVMIVFITISHNIESYFFKSLFRYRNEHDHYYIPIL